MNYWRNRLWLVLGDDRWFDTDSVHLHFFSPKSLVKKLDKYGFEVEAMKPLGRTKILSLCGGFVARFKKMRKLTRSK